MKNGGFMVKFQKTGFFIFAFFITYLIYVYPFEVLCHLVFESGVGSEYSLAAAIILFGIILYYFKADGGLLIAKLITYGGMGIGFISFWITNIGVLVNSMNLISPPMVGGICIVVIILTVSFALIRGRLIYVKRIRISSPKVIEPIRIIFISDTHLGSNSGNHLRRILSIIEDIDFDVFVIGGDFIDSSSFDFKCLNVLKNIKQPILFVSGNHEYYIKHPQEKLDALGKYGVTVLNNKAFKFKEINFIGISDNVKVNRQIEITQALLDESQFNFVLVHKPSLWKFVYKRIDFMMSGHTHNGQIFPFNFFVRFKYKEIYGLYELLASKLYVSSGSGCWGTRMRLGSRNEVVEVLIC